MKTLGEMIRKLRTDANIKQAELAKEVGVSREKIIRAEGGEERHNYSLIMGLSRCLNFDFLAYSLELENFGTTENFELFIRLREAITSYNMVEIAKVISEIDQISAIKISGREFALFENKNAVLEYWHGKLVLGIDWDRELVTDEAATVEAAETLLQSLGVIDFKQDIKTLFLRSLSTSECRVLCVVGAYFGMHGDYDKSQLVLEGLAGNLVHYILAEDYAPFYKDDYKIRVLIMTYNNLAALNFLIEEYPEALHWCDKGIETCHIFNYAYTLHMLCMIKFEILYKMERLQEAHDVYKDTVALCRILGIPEYIEYINQKIMDKYPKLELAMIKER